MSFAWFTHIGIKGNFLCPTLNPNKEDSYKEKIPQDMQNKEFLSYKETYS